MIERCHVFLTDSFCEKVPTGPALDLANAMSEISEECICSGWEFGLEYTLWGIMHGLPGFCMGWGEPSEAEMDQLRALHRAAGGWIVNNDPPNELVFLTTDQWLARWNARNSERKQ